MIENLFLWGLEPGHLRKDIPLHGSPQRCLSRAAVEDADGAVWMMERLRPGQFDRRERIGRLLALLHEAGLPVAAYLPGQDGRFAVEANTDHWQLSPYVPGDPLPQPGYVDDPERGSALGAFVASLHKASPAICEFDAEPPFILEDYVNELMAAMAPRRPELHEGLLPVLGSLAPLFEAWSHLPHTVSQGDFHPLNVIWQGTDVAAVIDWEFAGLRPALFDVANCLGCAGIEDPMALVRGLVPALLLSLRDKDCLDTASLSLLPEMIIGLRFAWMSEWLRRHDEEMALLEVRYIRLLTNSLDGLLPAWEKILA